MDLHVTASEHHEARRCRLAFSGCFFRPRETSQILHDRDQRSSDSGVEHDVDCWHLIVIRGRPRDYERAGRRLPH